MDIKRDLSLFLGILIFGLACYFSVIDSYFVSDDFVLIRKIAQEGMFYKWGESSGGFLRPITILSYWIDYKLWGLNPTGYHLTNIFFHAIAAFSLYVISRKLLGDIHYQERTFFSLAASCLFIVLPCHSESVSWISGRTDVIAVAFGFASTAIFLSVFRKESTLFSGLALLFLVIALLAKEVCIILPAIWVFWSIYYWYTEKRVPSKYSLVTLGIAWVILIGYVGLRKAVLGHFVGGYGTSQHVSLVNIETLFNLFKYGARTFLPPGLPKFLYVINFLVIAALVLIFLFKKLGESQPVYRWPIFSLLASCYLVGLVPTLTMSVSLSDTQNERFLYLSSGFACIVLAVILGKIFQRKSVQTSIFIFLISALAFWLHSVNTRWVNASILSEEIAVEISKMDLENLAVVNVPDHYQDAYIFRNGLQEAAMLISGKNVERKSGYLRAIAYHNLISLSQKIHVDTLGSTILLTLPSGLYFSEVNPQPFPVERNEQSLSITVPNEALKRLTFLSFESGARRPLLQSVHFK